MSSVEALIYVTALFTVGPAHTGGRRAVRSDPRLGSTGLRQTPSKCPTSVNPAAVVLSSSAVNRVTGTVKQIDDSGPTEIHRPTNNHRPRNKTTLRSEWQRLQHECVKGEMDLTCCLRISAARHRRRSRRRRGGGGGEEEDDSRM